MLPNLIELTDHNANATAYAYNERDLLEEIEYADAATRTFTHFDNDVCSGWTDENGTVVPDTLDDDSRLTSRSITRANGVLGVTSESYTRDGMGRMTQATNTDTIVGNIYPVSLCRAPHRSTRWATRTCGRSGPTSSCA